MSKRTAASIKKEIEEYQNNVFKLIAAGKKKEALKLQIEASKDGIKGLLDLDYQGKKVGDVEEFKEAKQLTDRLFKRVWDVFQGPVPFPLRELILFSDIDYTTSLFQALDVAGVFNESSRGMDSRLGTWFTLGFYGYVYELGGKPVLSYVNVFPNKKPYSKVGLAVEEIRTKYRIPEISGCFDSFLRNSIDHSEYVITDFAGGKFDAWNMSEGRRKPKRQYEVASVFKMTVRMIFFIVAYHCSYYETVIKLDEMDAIR